MRKYPIILILSILSTFPFQGEAQISNVSPNGVPLMAQKYTDVDGSPYLGEGKWFVGNMTDVDGKLIENVQLRFNAFDNQLEFYRSNQPFQVSKEDIVGFSILYADEFGTSAQMEFKVGKSISEDLPANEYLRVIYEGNGVSIFQRIEKDRISVTPAAYGESDYFKFVEKSSFYAVTASGIEEIKLNKRSFYDLLPEKKGKIKDFISKNEINFNNPEDVAQVALFIDNLISI